MAVVSWSYQISMFHLSILFSHSKTVLKAVFSLVLVFAITACSTLGDKGGEVASESIGVDPDLLFNLLAAEFAGNSGNLDESVDFYLKAAEASSDSRVAARAAYIALYNKNYDKALESIARWQDLQPEDPDLQKMYAIVYLKQGEPHKALTYIETILNKDKENTAAAALVISKLLQRESTLETSLVVLQALNKSSPDNPSMLLLHARFLAQAKQYDESLVLLDKVLALDSSVDDVYFIKARILSAQGRKKESIAVILKLLENNPDNTSLRMRYARMLIEDGNESQALEEFLTLEKTQPNNADILVSLSLLLIDNDRLDEAQDRLEQLIFLDKKQEFANYYLGRIEQSRNNLKSAMSFYLKVLHGQYVFDAKLRIAVLFSSLGKGDEAEKQLEILAENQDVWKNRVRVYLTHGEVLRELGKFEAALEMYSRVLRQNPDDPDLLYARAMIAEKVDRIDITESDLLKVLSSEPENANALNALGYTLADKTGRLEEALGYIQRAVDLLPDDPAILDSLGWVSYRLGKMQDALKWLKVAFDKLQDAEIAAHYGEVLWKANKKDKAEKVWLIGKKDNANHPVLVETLKRLKK